MALPYRKETVAILANALSVSREVPLREVAELGSVVGMAHSKVPLSNIELSLRRFEAFVVGFGRTNAMVREGAVERAMPMGNVAIADLTENTTPSKQEKSIQYP